ncbi:LacI family DNA-binding transcriptional regulator [Aureimonas sp. AU4]|uniref:LacI family DNA-binding transcriptional regulator n=1 Tax=Aureimonas sp. AU4 TaxID=1638163 RepID=UPI0007840AEC|nr:LacI family DNA-binding transcriptional regulator [Aureimonas sp. AU4]
MSKRSATLREIAASAGVSAATVSLVLNGKGDISEATRARVREAVTRANYVPRSSPRMPATSGETICFLKISKHGHTVNRDHSVFISDYLDGMSNEARRRGYTLEVLSLETASVDAIVQAAATTTARGLVVLGTELSENDVQLMQGVGGPKVFIDTYFDVIDANFVNMNNEDAVYRVLSRFKGLGLQRIGFVASHVDTTNFRLRYEAYLRNMHRLGLPVRDDDVIVIESTFDGAYIDASARLTAGLSLADCYFCTNDVMAFGFIRALREHGISVPGDVRVIGFDNLPQSATMQPPLTSIDVSKRKIGALAVSTLDDLIRSGEPQPPVKIMVGADLVLRGSDYTKPRRKVATKEARDRASA